MSISKHKVDTYKGIEIRAKIDEASPHQLISMLFDGLQSRLHIAVRCLRENDDPNFQKALEKALHILSELDESISTEVDSDLPYNLSRLYDYMQRQLLRARLQKSESLILEVDALVEPLASGWAQIGDKGNSPV